MKQIETTLLNVPKFSFKQGVNSYTEWAGNTNDELIFSFVTSGNNLPSDDEIIEDFALKVNKPTSFFRSVTVKDKKFLNNESDG